MDKTHPLFAGRRRFVQEQLPEDGIALFFSAEPRIRSNDVHYRFRQDSDFYYLTGFDEEASVLVLTRENQTLYLRVRDRSREIWDGPRLGVERAAETLAIDAAKPIEEFAKDLPELLKNKSALYYAFGLNTERDARVLGAARELLQRSRGTDYGPGRIVAPSLLLHEMRLIKAPYEIELLRECARITENGHRALLARTRPGMYEYELEAILLYEFRRERAEEGYPSIVASGPNACILHHIKNDRQLNEGDLVLVDAGAERDFMTADVTRTYPAGESFSAAQRDVYAAVLQAQERAIARTVAGSNIDDVHAATLRDLVQSLIDLGALKGGVDENLENKKFRNFYMHRTGHWLGTDVHDVGPYYDRGKPRPFQNGMVCTVEPGLYFSPDDPEAPEHLRGIGVRIEDDVLVNGAKPIALTASIPKQIDEIEALRKEALALAKR